MHKETSTLIGRGFFKVLSINYLICFTAVYSSSSFRQTLTLSEISSSTATAAPDHLTGSPSSAILSYVASTKSQSLSKPYLVNVVFVHKSYYLSDRYLCNSFGRSMGITNGEK